MAILEWSTVVMVPMRSVKTGRHVAASGRASVLHSRSHQQPHGLRWNWAMASVTVLGWKKYNKILVQDLLEAGVLLPRDVVILSGRCGEGLGKHHSLTNYFLNFQINRPG